MQASPLVGATGFVNPQTPVQQRYDSLHLYSATIRIVIFSETYGQFNNRKQRTLAVQAPYNRGLATESNAP
jgi:hypothetical protein